MNGTVFVFLFIITTFMMSLIYICLFSIQLFISIMTENQATLKWIPFYIMVYVTLR